MSVSSGDCDSIDYEALEHELTDEAQSKRGNGPHKPLVGDENGEDEEEDNLAADFEDFDALVAETTEILKEKKGPQVECLHSHAHAERATDF